MFKYNILLAMKKFYFVLIVFSVFSFVSCSEEGIDNESDLALEESLSINLDNDDTLYTSSKPIELEIVNLINEYRLINNLAPLDIEQQGIVKLKAKEHNEYMIKKSELSHDLFKERSRIIMDKTKAFRVGENVAYGYSQAKKLVDAWIASPTHRANILGDFNYFDISTDFSKSGVMYSTNIFIKK